MNIFNSSILLFVALLLTSSPILANNGSGEWEKVIDNNEIKVFTRITDDSPIKEIRITASINSDIATFVEALTDVDNYMDWVYKCSAAYKLETVNANEFYYYSKSDLPFPVSDRDLVVHSKQWTDYDTGIIYSVSSGAASFIPNKKGVVRIPAFESTWKIIPVSPGQIEIEYHAATDPGGSIPAWIVNLGVSTGPYKTLQALKKKVEQHYKFQKEIATSQNDE